jgi:hypothetical protein
MSSICWCCLTVTMFNSVSNSLVSRVRGEFLRNDLIYGRVEQPAWINNVKSRRRTYPLNYGYTFHNRPDRRLLHQESAKVRHHCRHHSCSRYILWLLRLDLEYFRERRNGCYPRRHSTVRHATVRHWTHNRSNYRFHIRLTSTSFSFFADFLKQKYCCKKIEARIDCLLSV